MLRGGETKANPAAPALKIVSVSDRRVEEEDRGRIFPKKVVAEEARCQRG